MKIQIHDLADSYVMTNSLGTEIHFSGELMAWNSVWLILLTIASFMVMVNRLKTNDNKHNTMIKILFGGLGLISLSGLLYPVEFGLIGVNIMVTIILIVDFFRHDKNKCNDNK